jgi:hypothetical protein
MTAGAFYPTRKEKYMKLKLVWEGVSEKNERRK